MLTPDFEQIGRFEAHRLPDGSVVYYEEKHHGYYGEIKDNPSSEGGYSRVDATKYAGASTIAKHLNDQGDGLLYWAADLDHQGIASLVAADMKAGRSLDWLTDAESIKKRLRAEKMEWKHVRDRMAEWGTNVHEKTFLELAQGNTPSLKGHSPEERPFAQAAFAWWRDRNPHPLAAEHVTVCHSRNFAGRFDLLCEIEIGGRVYVVLVDAKTRTSGKVRRADHVQLVGYDIANEECGIGGADLRLALILLPDGTYRESWSRATEADFNAALNAHRSGKLLDSRMKNDDEASALALEEVLA